MQSTYLASCCTRNEVFLCETIKKNLKTESALSAVSLRRAARMELFMATAAVKIPRW